MDARDSLAGGTQHIIKTWDDCMEAGGRATHDSKDGGGRVKQDARTEDAKAEMSFFRCVSGKIN